MATNYRNYRISSKTGKFYESSKQEQTGFNVKIPLDDGSVVWHRYSDELEGTLKKIQLQTVDFGKGQLKLLKIMWEEISGDVGSLSVPVLTAKGTLDSWIKALMLSLPNLKKKMNFKLQLNRSNKDKKGFLYKNAWFRDADNEDELIKWAFDPQKDTPPPIETEHPLTGEKKWDYNPVDKFYYDKLMELIETWGGNTRDDDPPHDTSTEQAYSGGGDAQGDPWDNLPF